MPVLYQNFFKLTSFFILFRDNDIYIKITIYETDSANFFSLSLEGSGAVLPQLEPSILQPAQIEPVIKLLADTLRSLY